MIDGRARTPSELINPGRFATVSKERLVNELATPGIEQKRSWTMTLRRFAELKAYVKSYQGLTRTAVSLGYLPR